MVISRLFMQVSLVFQVTAKFIILPQVLCLHRKTIKTISAAAPIHISL